MSTLHPPLSSITGISVEELLAALRTANVAVQYILECSDVNDTREVHGSAVCPPLFSINSKSLYSDPRTASSSSLIQATSNRLAIPQNYTFLHNFVVSVSATTTDSTGWEYGTSWSASEGGAWSKHPCTGADYVFKRRLWFRLVARNEISASLRSQLVNFIARRTALWHNYSANLTILQNSTWVNVMATIDAKTRNISLTDGTKRLLEYKFTVHTRVCEVEADEDDDPSNIASMAAPGAPPPKYQLSILDNASTSAGSQTLLCATQTSAERSQWIFHLTYFLALSMRSIDFQPFSFGPPFSSKSSDQVFFTGDMYKLDFSGKLWKLRHFELTLFHLRYFRDCELRGTIDIPGCTIISGEAAAMFDGSNSNGILSKIRNCLFQVLGGEGFSMTFRTESNEERNTWIEEITRQADSWPPGIGQTHQELPIFSLSETFDTAPCDDDVTIAAPYFSTKPVSYNEKVHSDFLNKQGSAIKRASVTPSTQRTFNTPPRLTPSVIANSEERKKVESTSTSTASTPQKHISQSFPTIPGTNYVFSDSEEGDDNSEFSSGEYDDNPVTTTSDNDSRSLSYQQALSAIAAPTISLQYLAKKTFDLRKLATSRTGDSELEVLNNSRGDFDVDPSFVDEHPLRASETSPRFRQTSDEFHKRGNGKRRRAAALNPVEANDNLVKNVEKWSDIVTYAAFGLFVVLVAISIFVPNTK